MTLSLLRKTSMAFLWLLMAAAVVPAQTAKAAHEEDSLKATVAALDSALFDAVNRCDLKTVDSFWDDNIEFYHDKSGLTVGRTAMTDSIRSNVCGKFVRELVPGTLEVYPIAGYGAVEIAEHRFLHPYAQDHGVVGQAKFMHLWQLKDGKWRITRAISYDHGLAK